MAAEVAKPKSPKQLNLQADSDPFLPERLKDWVWAMTGNYKNLSVFAMKFLRIGFELYIDRGTSPPVPERAEKDRLKLCGVHAEIREDKWQWVKPQVPERLHDEFKKGYRGFLKQELAFEIDLFRFARRHKLSTSQYHKLEVQFLVEKYNYPELQAGGIGQ